MSGSGAVGGIQATTGEIAQRQDVASPARGDLVFEGPGGVRFYAVVVVVGGGGGGGGNNGGSVASGDMELD